MNDKIKERLAEIDAESNAQWKLQEETATTLGKLSAERDDLAAQYFRDEVLPKLLS